MPVRLMQEIGPDFGIDDDDHCRLDLSKNAPDNKGEIDGEIEGVLLAELPDSHFLSGFGNGRKNESEFWIAFTQNLHQWLKA